MSAFHPQFISISQSLNVNCGTYHFYVAPLRAAGSSGYLAANLYAKSVFEEDALGEWHE